MINPDKAYTVAQTAELIGRSRRAVQAMAAAGDFPNAFAHRKADGSVDAYRIPGEDIRAYRARHAVTATR